MESNIDKFILDDFEKLLTAISLLKNWIFSYTKNNSSLDEVLTIEKRIQHQSLLAPFQIEGRMTFRVIRIVNSFRKLSTVDDVFENFAFLNEDELREFYDEEEKKTEPENVRRKRKKKKTDDSKKDE